MSVFENPTVAGILGGVAGALVAGIISVLIWRGSRTRKRIRAVIRDVTSLLDVSKGLKSKLKIELQGNTVDSLYLTSIDISNVGNASLEKQNIVIEFSNQTQIIDFSLSIEPQIVEDELVTNVEGNQLKTVVELLNPTDRLTYEILSTGNLNEDVQVYMRNKDVEEELVDARAGDFGFSSLLTERNLMFLAIASALPLFGGFARSMINVGVANRIENLNKRKV